MTPSPTDLVEAIDEAIRTLTAARTEATAAHRTEDAYEVASQLANAAHDVRELEAQAVALLRGWGGSWTEAGLP